MKTFQEQLTEARRASGISQEKLAELMNVTRPAVSHWENGRTLPDVESLKKLSQVLNYDFVQPKPEEEAEPPAAQPDGKNRKALWTGLIGLVAGLILGLVLGALLFPRQAAPAGALRTSDAVAQLVVGGREDPVKPQKTSEDREMWMYEVVIRNVSDVSFFVERVEQTMIAEDGREGDTMRYAPRDLGMADGVIPGNAEYSYGGGFPVQPLKTVHIAVYGADENQNALKFEGDINLSR